LAFSANGGCSSALGQHGLSDAALFDFGGRPCRMPQRLAEAASLLAE
jgi:hypothetical protein